MNLGLFSINGVTALLHLEDKGTLAGFLLLR